MTSYSALLTLKEGIQDPSLHPFLIWQLRQDFYHYIYFIN